MVQYIPVSTLESKLNGVILKVNSHKAREALEKLAPSLTPLRSLKWSLHAKAHAAQGFYLISNEDYNNKLNSRKIKSVVRPTKIPGDLKTWERGGLF